MSQTIISQIVTCYTDKCSQLSIKIVRQADHIKALKDQLAETTEACAHERDRAQVAIARNVYL